MATLAERKHLDAVAELGCIVCRNEGYGYTPATIHHLRHKAGIGRRSSHYETIPLCPTHHLHGGYGVAIHAGKRTWEKNFGREVDLLDQVRELLDG